MWFLCYKICTFIILKLYWYSNLIMSGFLDFFIACCQGVKKKPSPKKADNGRKTQKSRGISQPRLNEVELKPGPSEHQYEPDVSTNRKIRKPENQKQHIQQRNNLIHKNVNIIPNQETPTLKINNPGQILKKKNRQQNFNTNTNQMTTYTSPVSLESCYDESGAKATYQSNHLKHMNTTLPIPKIMPVIVLNNNNINENKNTIVDIDQNPHISFTKQANNNKTKPLILNLYETAFDDSITTKITQIGYSNAQFIKNNNYNTTHYSQGAKTAQRVTENKIQSDDLVLGLDYSFGKKKTKRFSHSANSDDVPSTSATLVTRKKDEYFATARLITPPNKSYSTPVEEGKNISSNLKYSTKPTTSQQYASVEISKPDFIVNEKLLYNMDATGNATYLKPFASSLSIEPNYALDLIAPGSNFDRNNTTYISSRDKETKKHTNDTGFTTVTVSSTHKKTIAPEYCVSIEKHKPFQKFTTPKNHLLDMNATENLKYLKPLANSLNNKLNNASEPMDSKSKYDQKNTTYIAYGNKEQTNNILTTSKTEHFGHFIDNEKYMNKETKITEPFFDDIEYFKNIIDNNNNIQNSNSTVSQQSYNDKQNEFTQVQQAILLKTDKYSSENYLNNSLPPFSITTQGPNYFTPNFQNNFSAEFVNESLEGLNNKIVESVQPSKSNNNQNDSNTAGKLENQDRNLELTQINSMTTSNTTRGKNISLKNDTINKQELIMPNDTDIENNTFKEKTIEDEITLKIGIPTKTIYNINQEKTNHKKGIKNMLLADKENEDIPTENQNRSQKEKVVHDQSPIRQEVEVPKTPTKDDINLFSITNQKQNYFTPNFENNFSAELVNESPEDLKNEIVESLQPSKSNNNQNESNTAGKLENQHRNLDLTQIKPMITSNTTRGKNISLKKDTPTKQELSMPNETDIKNNTCKEKHVEDEITLKIGIPAETIYDINKENTNHKKEDNDNMLLADKENEDIPTENQNRTQKKKFVRDQSPISKEVEELKTPTEDDIDFQMNKKVIEKLKKIKQKSEPFENEIEKFTELEDSNKYYYIEENLRRLIDKLDDMFEDIGENKVLRDERKKVYKFIFPLFEKLDEKVAKNRQQIEKERNEGKQM